MNMVDSYCEETSWKDYILLLVVVAPFSSQRCPQDQPIATAEVVNKAPGVSVAIPIEWGTVADCNSHTRVI